MTSLASDYVLALRLFMRTEEVSQRELARRLDVSEARVSQILNEPGNFTIATMERVAGALGADLHIEFRKRNGEWCDNDNPVPDADEIDALHSLLKFYTVATRKFLLIEALPVKWRRNDVGGTRGANQREACARALEHVLDPKLWCGICGMASDGPCAHCGSSSLVNSIDAELVRDKCRLHDAKTWLHDIGTNTLHGSLPAATLSTGLGHLAAMIERVEKLEQ